MAEVTNTPSSPGMRRRSQRVLMQIALRLRGMDAQGQNFEEFTSTLAINAHGALVLLSTRVTSGGVIHVKNVKTEEEQECHVAFLGPVRGGKAEVGLEFTVPRPAFWRVTFPPEDWSPKHPDARAPISRVRVEK